ncbi:hypothetical protein [Glutamicibacter sp. BW80]|uniref:hypothetical protein n=1 Tax=Glutamicibacter sp. BW80 TaxID=2024404 RepID=UPI001143808E|nr:hypothetical protein [Glutamicibacter sp. BW80]
MARKSDAVHRTGSPGFANVTTAGSGQEANRGNHYYTEGASPMGADWFTEDMRDQDAGYALARPREKFHVYRYRIAGPGALHRTALCHGVQGVVMVSSGLDLDNEAECMAWLNGETGIFGGRRFPAGEDLKPKLTDYQYAGLCARCKASYERKKP